MAKTKNQIFDDTKIQKSYINPRLSFETNFLSELVFKQVNLLVFMTMLWLFSANWYLKKIWIKTDLGLWGLEQSFFWFERPLFFKYPLTCLDTIKNTLAWKIIKISYLFWYIFFCMCVQFFVRANSNLFFTLKKIKLKCS